MGSEMCIRDSAVFESLRVVAASRAAAADDADDDDLAVGAPAGPSTRNADKLSSSQQSAQMGGTTVVADVEPLIGKPVNVLVLLSETPQKLRLQGTVRAVRQQLHHAAEEALRNGITGASARAAVDRISLPGIA